MAEIPREPPELRLLDVLLEEELGARGSAQAARESASRRSSMRARICIAATILFGLGVVAVTAWSSRRPTVGVAAVQSPQGRGPVETAVPRDLDELRHLLDTVTRVRVQRLAAIRPAFD